MRIALVTSEVNYVRDNYHYLIREVIRHHGSSVKAIVVIRTLDWKLVLKMLALPFMGCPGLAWNLFRNAVRVKVGGFFNQFITQERKIFYTHNINSVESQRFLRSLDLDLILNARTRNIYKKDVLEIPRWGCMNIHHGMLPQYRGTMCDLWALAQGRPVGFSIHWMNQKIDDGKLIRVEEVGHLPTKNYAHVPYISSQQEARALIEVLSTFEKQGPIEGVENPKTALPHTKNPNLKQIRWIRSQGVDL